MDDLTCILFGYYYVISFVINFTGIHLEFQLAPQAALIDLEERK
jgi:hypothetical protein